MKYIDIYINGAQKQTTRKDLILIKIFMENNITYRVAFVTIEKKPV
jgi:hypothetical protein